MRNAHTHPAPAAVAALAGLWLALGWSGPARAALYPVGGAQGGGYASGGDESYRALLDVEPRRRDLPPTRFALRMTSSNPVRAVALFELDLPRAARVTARLYDVAGRQVSETLAGRLHEPGTHRLPVPVAWLPSGHYLWKVAVTGIEGEPLFDAVRRIARLR